MMCKVLVLGVGNVMMGDEGFGVRVARRLLAEYMLPPGVDVVDGGTSGLALLPLLMDTSRIVIVDAVEARAKPGSIFRFEAEAIEEAPRVRLSQHDMGVLEVLKTARLMGSTAPATVIGVQPERMDDFGSGLSAVVAAQVEKVLAMIVEIMKEAGLEPHPRGRRSPGGGSASGLSPGSSLIA